MRFDLVEIVWKLDFSSWNVRTTERGARFGSLLVSFDDLHLPVTADAKTNQLTKTDQKVKNSIHAYYPIIQVGQSDRNISLDTQTRRPIRGIPSPGSFLAIHRATTSVLWVRR